MQVIRHDDTPDRAFLLIRHEKELYMGGLMVDAISFCKQIFRLLQSYVGYSIKEIGAIDLSHIL